MTTLPPDSRFASPTSSLDPATLLRPLRKVFLVSLGAALALHLVIVAIDPFEQTAQKAPRPLTTRFIKREPRLTKPLELRKLPQPKRQMVRRQVQLARARMDQVQATATFNTRGLITQVATAAPQARMGQAGSSAILASMNLEPSLSATAVTGVRSPDNKIDLGLEMMDVNSMDTGRYRAMVIQDPEDPQALKGFVKFASVTSARSIDFGSGGGFGQGFIDRVRDALNQFTGLQSEYVGLITFDDERLLEVPIIFRANPGNESEKERMVQYLLAGGFVCGGVGDNWGRPGEVQRAGQGEGFLVRTAAGRSSHLLGVFRPGARGSSVKGGNGKRQSRHHQLGHDERLLRQRPPGRHHLRQGGLDRVSDSQRHRLRPDPGRLHDPASHAHGQLMPPAACTWVLCLF